MKCTCDKFKEVDAKQAFSEITNLTWEFCPWCGSPLLPDPVEKTEWRIETDGTLNSTIYESESAALIDFEKLERLCSKHPHTLKSITTIEKVIKIVRPK